MFRHARQLDLARRLNHADRKERILISLRDESRDSSRNPSFSVRHRPFSPSYFFLSSLTLPSLSPSNRPFGPTKLLLPLLLLLPPIGQFLFFFLPRPSRRLRVQIVFSLSLPPSPSYNYQQRNTLEFSPFFSADKSCNEENATFPDDSLRNFSPSREPNNDHRIVRVLIIIFRSQTRRIKKKDSKEKRKEERKEGRKNRWIVGEEIVSVSGQTVSPLCFFYARS